MKFRISKENFQEGLQQVQHVVSARTTLPILSNVLLEADGKELKLTTTDLDVGVSGRVEAEVEIPGATTLPARKLASIIRELPTSEIEFSSDADHKASITSGPSYFRIHGLSEDEFPPLPDFEDAKEFKIPQATLKDALRKTSFAISTDETRYVLNGIFCQFKDNTMILVATDGRRLAMVDHEIEFPQSQETEVIVPTKAVNELQRLLGTEGDVKILIGESQIAFELNQNILVSKLIEGNYPNFRQVVPTETKERITLERETFLGVVSRVSILASDKSNSVKLVFSEDNIDVMANSPEIGEAKESLPVQYKGPPITIAFNPEFLQAPLRNLDTDEVFLDLIDEMSPGVIKNSSSFLYVLMPMRVSG
ncbi:DNA polymerase III subunit beta [soil metagenome]